MAATTEILQDQSQQPLFTCLSCSIAFLTPQDQRLHYRSDHHRYNMKRRVASLPPVSVSVFNEKVLQRKQETAITTSSKGSTCDVCNKSYTTENAYRSHLNSKRHRDNELKANTALKVTDTPASEQVEISKPPAPAPAGPSSLAIDSDADEDTISQTIDAKIAAARSRLTPEACLFCPVRSASLDASLIHMAQAHSFFIPDAEYLTDLPGLIGYLGEKVAVGNVCLFCNERSREFRTVEAVWKHMSDKGHCKIAYDTEKDRLEISDYYDFSSSYPDAVRHGKEKARTRVEEDMDEAQDEWEDVDDDGEEADEIIEENDESDDDLPENQLTYGDSPYELVLPSGARIGHRSMRHYYTQSFPTVAHAGEDPKSGAAIVRRLIADKRSDLVPAKGGGYGAFGAGTQVIRARNRGEAREAGRHIREFRDQRRKEEYKTRVGFTHNHQKHYRDPLLQ